MYTTVTPASYYLRRRLGWARTGSVLAFNEFPEQWERLRSDHKLVRPAVEELLRFVTPIRAMRRTATADVEMYGKTIRAGDKVVLWFESANRELGFLLLGRYFASPVDLVPGRWGEASYLYSAATATASPTAVNRTATGWSNGPNIWPGPGQTLIDDNGNIQQVAGDVNGP